MTSSSSFEESILSALEEQNVKLADFVVLHPYRWGVATMGDGSGRQKYTLHMQASEPEPKMKHEEKWPDKDCPRRYLKMYLYFSDQNQGRFVPKGKLGYHVLKKITAGHFSIVSDWMDTQTSKGSWSVSILADRQKRPGRSWMLFHFEAQEDAMMFKLFQEDIDLKAPPSVN